MIAVVLGVLRAALKSHGARGFALAGPPGPANELIRTWLTEAGMEARVPEPGTVARVARALAGDESDDREEPDGSEHARTSLAYAALAHELARRGQLLVVGAESKTHLLLDGSRAPILPLGDVWASRVRDLAGAVRLPRALSSIGVDCLREVDQALSDWLERGLSMERAFQPLPPPVREAVLEALGRAAPDVRPPLVPKLSPWTAGVDLAL